MRWFLVYGSPAVRPRVFSCSSVILMRTCVEGIYNDDGVAVGATAVQEEPDTFTDFRDELL